MTTYKDYAVSIISDATAILFFYAMLHLHVFLMTLHPFYQFIANNTKDTLLTNPDSIPSNTVLISGFIYIILLIILTALIIITFFLITRVILYNYLHKKKFTLKPFWKHAKIISAGIFLIYVPGYILFFLLFMLSAALLIGLEYFTGISQISNFITIPQSFLSALLLISLSIYYLSTLKDKKYFQGYVHFFNILKRSMKKILFISILFTIAINLILLFQMFVLSKLSFMYAYKDIWLTVIGLATFTYIRIEGYKVFKHHTRNKGKNDN